MSFYKIGASVVISLVIIYSLLHFWRGQLGDFVWLTHGVLVEIPTYATQTYKKQLEDFFGLRVRPVFSTIVFPNGQTMVVEVVSHEAKQERGLSDREEPQAMLFLFEDHDTRHFWMKDMHFAIDFIWLDGNTVVGFEKNAQPENPPKTIYTSPTLINAVLELPAGSVENLSLKIGDVLDRPLNAE